MIRDAEPNIIENPEYLLNEHKDIVDRYKRKLIESQKIWGNEITETT